MVVTMSPILNLSRFSMKDAAVIPFWFGLELPLCDVRVSTGVAYGCCQASSKRMKALVTCWAIAVCACGMIKVIQIYIA